MGQVSGATVYLIVFTFIFTVIFSIFAVAFTAFTAQDAALNMQVVSSDDLMRAGITMTKSVSNNVTDDNTWVSFPFAADLTFLVRWDPATGYIYIENHPVLFGYFTQVFRMHILHDGYDVNNVFHTDFDTDWVQWISDDYNADYGWTHHTGYITAGGVPIVGWLSSTEHYQLLYTPSEGFQDISTSLAAGKFTLTIGQGLDDTDYANPAKFINYYISSITFSNPSLPWYFSLILDIMTILSVIAILVLVVSIIP
jgi:hypothetical protein